MKTSVLVLAIVLHLYSVSSASTQSRNKKVQNFETALRNKCYKNSHDIHAFDKFEQATKDFNNCTNKFSRGDFPNPIKHHEEFCQAVRDQGLIQTCLKDLLKSLKPCLDKSEMYLPRLILNVYTYAYEKVCGLNGFININYLNQKIERNHDCIGNEAYNIMMGGVCIANLTTIHNFNQNILELSHEDYCNDMPFFVECVTDLLNSNCEENFDFLAAEVSKPFLEVCQVLQLTETPEIVTTRRPSVRPELRRILRI